MRRLTERFAEAFGFARALHDGQVRTGSGEPYVAHLMATCALVLEYGGDEEQATAALLHDAAEDQGGAATLRVIQERFGARVAGIVRDCSDSLDDPPPPWRERKEAYLAHLAEVDADTRLVATADKLHNARCIVRDLEQHGEALWERFAGGRDGVLWYYGQLARTLASGAPAPMGRELANLVKRMNALAGA